MHPDRPASGKATSSVAEILDDIRAYLEGLRDDGQQTVELRPATWAALKERPVGPVKPAATQRPAALPASVPPAIVIPPPAPGETAAAGLKRIAAAIALCRQCPLHKTRTRTVPGQGSPQPEVLFVGEGPGADEDRQGLAFVGKAGQLLTKMIAAMGYTREEVFIANVVKCHPPGDETTNRQPSAEEMATCLPYLRAQIAILRPKVIVALGAVAVRGLLRTDIGVMRLRGKWQDLDGIPVMPTYHPAYLLRYLPAKKDAWTDLQEVMRRLGRPLPAFTKKSAGTNPPA